MRAAQIKAFGDVNDHLTVESKVPVPVLPPTSAGRFILIKVFACSLSPSDYRMSTGDADLIKKPAKNGWPYIPGGDVGGVVERVQEGETRFKVGDRVIGTWESFGMGGLAEYTVVDTRYVEHLPRGFSFLEGAAMADSPSNGMLAVEDGGIKAGDRVLVLGGSGAVGNVVVQLAKKLGAAFIAATSTDEKLVRGLGANVVVNYRRRNWWECSEIVGGGKFDVVVDCAEGVKAWNRVVEHGLVKNSRQGGRFVAVVVNDWHIEIHSVWGMLSWFAPIVGRTVGSRIRAGKVPKYMMLFPAPRGDSLQRCVRKIADGDIRVIIDPRSPFQLTTKGVREAFDLMIARGGHGKVVIAVRNE